MGASPPSLFRAARPAARAVGQVGLLKHLQFVGDEAGLVFEHLMEITNQLFLAIIQAR